MIHRAIGIALTMLALCSCAGDGGSADGGPHDVATDATSGADATDAVAPQGHDAGPRPGHDAGPRPEPRACDGLAPEGTWEDITPDEVRQMLPGPAGCEQGTFSFEIDPNDGSTIYLGTCRMGVWRSTDCGASWIHVNTGRNGALLDIGAQWTFGIDPRDPQVIYTNSGYGHNGLLKSTNGGVDWDVIFPNDQPELAGLVGYDFVALVDVDPRDGDRLLLTFHGICNLGHNVGCFLASEDAGAHWRIIEGDSRWAPSEGARAYFAGDAIIMGSQPNGLWSSADGGATWTDLGIPQSHNAPQLYQATNGVFYMGSSDGVIRSPDGLAWTRAPDSGFLIQGLTGTGTTLWASRESWDPAHVPYNPFYSASETTGVPWAHRTDTPMLINGGELRYDRAHRLLYSSNRDAGIYRVVTP